MQDENRPANINPIQCPRYVELRIGRIGSSPVKYNEVIDDWADVVFCGNTQMWYVAHVNGSVSKQLFNTSVQAKQAYKEGWITWLI